jgi:hypothetical protein
MNLANEHSIFLLKFKNFFRQIVLLELLLKILLQF